MTPPDYDDLCKRLRSDVIALMDVRAAADAIAALREQVAAKDAEIARLLHLINMDFDCLPTCDKFGHAEGCPYVEGEPKLRILAERAERAEADNAALRQDAERYRWLRGEHGTTMREMFFCDYATRPYPFNEQALDAAIDAALLAGKKP